MEDRTQSRRQKLTGLFAVCLSGILVTGLALWTGVLSEIESRTWDWRLWGVASLSNPDPRIKIIVIDQSSLDHFAEEERIFWPWPRGMYEAVVNYLNAAGTEAIAFDILFTEQSSWGVEDDRAFAAAIGTGAPVVNAVALRTATQKSSGTRLESFRQRQLDSPGARAITATDLPLGAVGEYRGAALPIEELIESSSGFGNVSAGPDSDGIFRHYHLGGRLGDTTVLGLPLALYASKQPITELIPYLDRATDSAGRLTVRFSGGPRTYQTYPIDAIIRSAQLLAEGKPPLISPEEFRGSWVFVGMDAPGLLDLRPTPLAEIFPGVEYHATVLDNLINRSFMRKFGGWASWFLSAVFIVVITTLCLSCRTAITIGLVAAAGTGAFVLIVFGAALAGFWLPLVQPLLGIGTALFGGFGLQYYLEGRKHRFLKGAFKHYVSPAVIDQIIRDPSRLALGGERRELTIFFSDLAGFTTLSEKMDPSRLMLLLNRYLTSMTEVVLEYGGTLDKYEGDAIVAFWNAPIAVEDHAVHAVRAAIECQRRLEELNKELDREFGVRFRMRIGLHTGLVSVGNFGSRDRFNYTVIGDAANLASRLEGANKAFGTTILISEVTQQQLHRVISCRKVADIRVVGRREVVPVYEPLLRPSPTISIFEQCRLVFEAQQLARALDGFRAMSEDPVAQAYVKRLEDEISDGLKDWSPVWNLIEK